MTECKIVETILRDTSLRPLLKYPGGKTGDINKIRIYFPELIPSSIENYYEPFLGGGAFWLSLNNVKNMFVNDASTDLIGMYKAIKNKNRNFRSVINSMDSCWNTLEKLAATYYTDIYNGDMSFFHNPDCTIYNIISSIDLDVKDVIEGVLRNKLEHIEKLEKKYDRKLPGDELLSNIECGLKSGYYTYIRHVYNTYKKEDYIRFASYYFLREYSFSSMFRFSRNGNFNVPYGGISYNKKSPSYRVKHWTSSDVQSHMKNTTFCNLDFEEFMNIHNPKGNDFAFIDPPYDSEFSTYDQNIFSKKDQERLAEYLINKTHVQFLAIMKNTDFIFNLYSDKEDNNIHWKLFDKKYSVSFKNRNNKDAEHIVVYRITK